MQINNLKFVFLLILFNLSLPANAAKKVLTDHPLVSPYQGSKIYSKDVKKYDEYRVFKGWDKAAKKYNEETLEGKVTRVLYYNPKERSVLELFRNYQSALAAEGAETLYKCNQAKMECVNGYVGAHLRQQFGISSIGNKTGRYLYAKLEQDDHTAFLALGVGDKYTDIHIVEMKKMETGKAALNLEALTKGLDKRGFVVVEGIYFDSDKTQLKAESSEAITLVAQLLKERAKLQLYVVGHTDMQGSMAHNMALSLGRAKAVVSELVKSHGIDNMRLEGKGLGPLAPVASNNDDNGRAKNRRVVLVQR